MKRIHIGLVIALALLSATVRGQEGAKNVSAARPKTYGVDQVSYYRIAASEFTLLDTADGALYTDEWYVNQNGQFQRYVFGSNAPFVASPHLPSGAVLTYFELDSCDESAEFNVFAQLYVCDFEGACTDPYQVLTSSNNATPCGSTSANISAAGIQVDEFHKQISILVQPTSGTDATRFAGVILGYELRVSPPPFFVDFNDVPMSSPQFQFVEALYHSGITAGCGNGNYCPNDPLTRGQMAVFLSKALGLDWPAQSTTN